MNVCFCVFIGGVFSTVLASKKVREKSKAVKFKNALLFSLSSNPNAAKMLEKTLRRTLLTPVATPPLLHPCDPLSLAAPGVF